MPTADPQVGFKTSAGSARHLTDALASVGALVSGRRNFDIAGGWGATHPMGVVVFVITHPVPDG